MERHRADFGKKIEKMERAVEYLVTRHREADERGKEEPCEGSLAKQIKTLDAAVTKVKRFFDNDDKWVARVDQVKNSNHLTESAKMKTGNGVIQGYDGLAVVDGKRQVVVDAQAFGEAQEHGLLVPMLEQARETFHDLGHEADVLKRVILTADAGFHSETNVKYLERNGIDGYVADTMFRKRDPRFATAERHKPLREPDPDRLFHPEDFQFDRQRAAALARRASGSTAAASTTVRMATVRLSSRVPSATVAPARCDIGVCATRSAPQYAKWCYSSSGSNRTTRARG